MKQHELSVLSTVIAVARRELSDREDAEIPPRLRKVARYSGRGLPPPFQISLVKELRDNDAFRAAVLERWERQGCDDSVGLSFLTDPDSGADAVSEHAEARTIAALAEDLARARQRIQSLESQVAESKTRMASEVEGHRAEMERLGRGAAASRASLDKAVRSLRERIADLEADRHGHAAVVASLTAKIDDLTAKLERSVERARKRAQQDRVAAPRQMSPPSDPAEFAAWLDAIERKQRSFRAARKPGRDGGQGRAALRVPAGLRPDSRDILVALIEQHPDTIYIDGDNVAAMLSEEFGSSRARTRVAAIADRLAAASRSRVVVVFDAVGVEGRPRMRSAGSAEIQFTRFQIADDEIVDMVRANPDRAAVVTSDRELIIRCTDVGCVTVWSEALVQWASGSS